MNLGLRVFAGLIDLLQFLFFVVFLGFQLMTPAGGGAAGAAGGAYACWSLSGGILEGIANAVACAAAGGIGGALLSAFAIPLGIAIDMTLSWTLGLLLIIALVVTGRFSFMAVVAGFTVEMMPGLNAFIPGWSLLVHRSLQAHKLKRQGVGLAGRTMLSVAGSAAGLVPGGSIAKAALKPALGAAAYGISAATTPLRDTGRVPLKNFDGIRPASGANPKAYA